MCDVNLNERKKSEVSRELVGLEPISLMIKKSRLRLFGHVEGKDDNSGSNDVRRGKLKELDTEDTRKRPRGIVIRTSWKV